MPLKIKSVQIYVVSIASLSGRKINESHTYYFQNHSYFSKRLESSSDCLLESRHCIGKCFVIYSCSLQPLSSNPNYFNLVNDGGRRCGQYFPFGN